MAKDVVNIEPKLSEKGILTLKIDLNAEPYGEGDKTFRIATSRGSQEATAEKDNDLDLVRYSVNVFKYKERK